MADISRLELPEEFFDVTSDLLLAQPEPQYLYCQMFKAALAADLSVPSMVGVPGREVGGNGAEYSSAERDRLAMSDPVMTQTVAGRVNMSGLPGHTMRFNRPQFANTTYTQASRTVAANASISTSSISVGSEQVSLTLGRFAGPYDQTNSRVAPYGVDALDATLGVHRLASLVGNHLRRDYDRFVDSVQVALLDGASTVVYPDGMSADNDATSAGAFPFTYEQISRCEQQMDEANLPTYPDGTRLLVLHPIQCKQLKDDPQFARYAEFHREYNALFPSYIGSVGKFRIHKSTTLTAADNSSSVSIKRGHAIAPGALLGGMGRRPSVRYASDDNYGESQKVIWLADLAFGLADDRFVVGVRSSE